MAVDALVGCATSSGLNRTSTEWRDKQAIEQRVRTLVPIGSSAEVTKTLLQKEGLMFYEYPTQERPLRSISVHFLTRRGIPGMITSVAMYFDSLDHLERIEVREDSRGFL